MKTSINETMLLEKQDVRQELIGQLEVLGKVKKLFLIPELEAMTMRQVADYYEVDFDTLRKCYQRNKIEIDFDGVTIKSYKDFLMGHNVALKTAQGKTTIKFSDSMILEIPSRGISVFPKRAILRIGMLLRDSKVAQEVRTQLLNTFEHSNEQQRTQEIDEEQKLILELGRAVGSGDFDELLNAQMAYNKYRNRYISKIESENLELTQDNKALAGEILKWNERPALNKAIRILSSKLNNNFGSAWNLLYDELRYKHGIGLTSRGGRPYINHIKEHEWHLAIQSFSAICESHGVSPSKIIERAKLTGMR